MSEKDLPPPRLRLPSTLQEQLEHVPFDPQERNALAEAFKSDIKVLLDSHGISIIEATSRGKSDESIQAKKRRKPLQHQNNPIVDIFGTRFVLHEDAIDEAVDLLKIAFNPPQVYPWGLESCLDHRTDDFKSKRSLPEYKAVHLYLPFGITETTNIGEVQLLTPEWKLIADETRPAYEERRSV